MSIFLLGIVKERAASAYFLTHDHEITPDQAGYLADRSMQVLLVGGQMVVHKVAADRFKTTRKKKDSKRKKERIEAKDVPERRKERIAENNVARKGGGRVVE